MIIVSYPLWACSEEPYCYCQSPWTETRPVPSAHLEACRQEEGYQLVKRHQRERERSDDEVWCKQMGFHCNPLEPQL